VPTSPNPQPGDAERSSLVKINSVLFARNAFPPSAGNPYNTNQPTHGDNERSSLIKINDLLAQGSGGGGGGGDMLKSIYDTNLDGISDHAALADSVPWTGVTGKPSTFTPNAHATTHNLGGSDVIAPDWTQIQNRNHAPSHLDNGTDPIPVATTLRTGAAPKLSGTATTFLNGTGAYSTPAGVVPAAHASTHLSAGSDPIAIATSVLAGLCPAVDNTTIQVVANKLSCVSLAYSNLTGVPATFAPSAHQASHVTGTDQIPSASASARGLLAQLSGNTTDYVGGDNVCHALAPAVWKGFLSKTATYTLTTADSGKYIICSGGSWTLTLPAPAAGLYFQVRNDMGITGTVGTITIQPTGGTIDGLTSIPLLPQQECTIITDGTNWRTFGLKREVILGIVDTVSSTASVTILLPVGYRLFELNWANVLSVTNRDLLVFQFSQDGGSTWITNYAYGIIYDNTATTVIFTYTGAATYGIASAALSNVATQNVGQSRVIISPGKSGAPATYITDAGAFDTTVGVSKYDASGFAGVNGAVNALKYYCLGGNFTNSFLTVKGVV